MSNLTIFDSDYFKSLDKQEQREVVIQEFKKCAIDFDYYINNYAYVRHPNVGIIKMVPFDFQLDAVNHIWKTIVHGRNPETLEIIKQYKHKFNYSSWKKKIAEQYIDLLRLVPQQVHDHYGAVVLSPYYQERIDTIILKSRQTGISTIFEQISCWSINFHISHAILTLSMRDAEAKKFKNDVFISWSKIPSYIRSRKVKNNEHELFTTFTGKEEDMSMFTAMTAVPDTGRSQSPKLIILDEFAAYKKPEEIWTSILFATSGGGVIVIIATPKGVSNLFYKFWIASKNSISLSFKDNVLSDRSAGADVNVSTFRPIVLHWSMLPQSEFIRRGFEKPVDWYNHMAAKLKLEKGQKSVAQELDLEFLTSGDTAFSSEIIKYFNNHKVIGKPLINTTNILNGFYVLDHKRNENDIFIIGVDVASGRGLTYSTAYIFKYNYDIKKNLLGLPKLVAYYFNNRINPKRFAKLLAYIGIKYYNTAYLMIEGNNYGHTVLTELEDIYPQNKIFNAYLPNKATFNKALKGWDEKGNTREFLIDFGIDFIEDNYEDLVIPEPVFDEMLTFIDTGKRYEHAEGFTDDNIFGYFLGAMGCHLLRRFKKWLTEIGEEDESYIDDYFHSSDTDDLGDFDDIYSNKYVKVVNKEQMNKLISMKEKKEAEKQESTEKDFRKVFKRNFASVVENDIIINDSLNESYLSVDELRDNDLSF